MRFQPGRNTSTIIACAALSAGLLMGAWSISGCGGSGSTDGTKCSQCGDTDGPCDNPRSDPEKVCWDTGSVCSSDSDCAPQPCVEAGKCAQSGGLCSQDADCRKSDTDTDTCQVTKECLVSGVSCLDVGGRSECVTNLCVRENLQCLRKIGSAERICFDVNLANTPERQCGTRFSLFVPAAVTTTTTTTVTTTTTSSTASTTTTTLLGG